MRADIGCGNDEERSQRLQKCRSFMYMEFCAPGVGHGVRFHQHGRKFVAPVLTRADVIRGCRGCRGLRHSPEAADQQHVTDFVTQRAAVDRVVRCRSGCGQCSVDACLELRLIEIGHAPAQLPLDR
ncbi:MAG: hypothetical protein ACJ8GV_09420 [Luteimonas sp.]